MPKSYAIQFKRCIACFVGAWLALASLSLSHAQALPDWQLIPKTEQTATGTRVTYGANGSPVQSLGRTVAVAANDAVAVSDRLVIQSAAGPVEATATRTATGTAARASLARGLIRAAAGGLAGAAALAAGEYLLGSGKDWILSQGYEEGPDGNFYPKSNKPPSPATDTAYTGNGPYYCYGAICATQNNSGIAFQQAYGSGYGYLQYTSSVTYNVDYTVGTVKLGAWKNTSNYNGPPDIEVTETRYYKQIQACASGYIVGPGDACPPNAPAPVLNDAYIEDKASTGAFPPGPLGPMLDAADALGVPIPLSTDVALSGPAFVASSPVQSAVYTSTLNGSTQTVTEAQAVRSNLAYNNGYVTETAWLETTKTNPQTGEVTKEEKSLSVKPEMCKGLSILACAELGAVPADEVPKSTKTIAFDTESISLPSGCPADIQVGRFGALSFASACTAAESMRPLILAGAAFISLMICVTAVAGVRV